MFWDSSALTPLCLPEARSTDLLTLAAADRDVTIWWSSPVECLSAIYRRHRDRPLPAPQLADALGRLQLMTEDANGVLPTEDVRRRAARLLATHALRAADALQLAAALVWCEDQTAGEVLVTLDERLREAAVREGFDVRPGG